jgi:HK97 family phage major capsid protein
MTLKEMREKQQQLVAQARAKMDELKSDTPEARAKEIEREHDAIMAEYDTLEGRCAREEKLADAQRLVDERNRDPRRPQGNDVIDPSAPQPKPEDYSAAFRSFLIYGFNGCTPDEKKLLRARFVPASPGEQRAQAVGTGSEGGYLVPTTLFDEIAIAMKAYGPMLDPGVTRQITTDTGNPINWPKMDDTANQAYLLGENTQATDEDTNLTIGQLTMNAYKYASGVILVSSELLQDAAFDVAGLVRDAMGIRFGRKLNSDLTIGNGSSKPNGLITAAGSGATAASSTAITFDDVMELEHSIDPAYRDDPSCRFMMHDTTLKALRKLKDGEGRYIWQPAATTAGIPATILEKPYSINQAMATIATGNKSMVYGAMNRYVVRRTKEFAVRRLVERYADFDQIGFLGFGRFDGQVTDSAAIKVLVHP